MAKGINRELQHRVRAPQQSPGAPPGPYKVHIRRTHRSPSRVSSGDAVIHQNRVNRKGVPLGAPAKMLQTGTNLGAPRLTYLPTILSKHTLSTRFFATKKYPAPGHEEPHKFIKTFIKFIFYHHNNWYIFGLQVTSDNTAKLRGYNQEALHVMV